MDVAVVGAGRVGTALAVLLQRAGHRIVAVAGREEARGRAERFLPGVPFLPAPDASAGAEVVLIGVPDDRIAAVCADVAAAGGFRPAQAVGHLSGSVTLDALASAEDAGAVILSLHPLQTAPAVKAAVERLPGSAVAVTARTEEGYRLGERLAAEAGGRPFRLDDRWKALYHAAAVFCSNYVTVVVGMAERLLRTAGLRDPVALLAPLARTSLDHALSLGPGAALTGPAVRGDAGTIRRNLQALEEHAPDALPAYVALASAALALAEEAGRLPPEDRSAVEEALAPWR